MEQENWQQVKDIFFDVERQKPEDRQEFLEKVCDGKKDIRREVESLLSSHDLADSFMESAAVFEVADAIVDEIPQFKSGQPLGHYDIIRQIGKGGMGEVYLALDRMLERKVAIKVLFEKFSRDESDLQRFIREAKAASSLNHPSILVIHEIGETEDSRYIVSEFVEGATLRESTRDKSLKLSEALDFSIQIAGALSAAHEANLVHRDIKPENIMIRPDGIVKILDFGLAKLVERKDMPVTNLEGKTKQQNQTGKGTILGTVNYMSPEQAKGKSVDERTDIFSFGVVLYEMITGQQPFNGESANETIAEILKSDPPPFLQYVSIFPAELERIVRKTLQKRPENRYQQIKELLTDIRNLDQKLEFEAKLERSVQPNREPPEKVNNDTRSIPDRKSERRSVATAKQNISSAEFITKGIRRHKFVSFAGLAALVIALAAYGYFPFFYDANNQIDSIAVMPFVNASGDKTTEYLSDGMTETLITSLSKIPNLSVKASSSVFRYKGKEIHPKRVGEELNVEAVLTGRVDQRGEDLSVRLELVDVRTENVLWSERFDRKMSSLVSLQSQIARQVSRNLRIDLTSNEREQVARTYTENSEAQNLYLQGRFHWKQRNEVDKTNTTNEFQKAIDYFNEAVEKDPNYALAYSGLADVYALMPMYGPFTSLEYMPLAKKAAVRALELDNNLAEAHASYGQILSFYDYDWKGAEREYKRAIELDPKYATAHHWYAMLLVQQRMHTEAVREMSKALELEPSSQFFNIMMGHMHLFSRKYDEAIVQYKKAIEMYPANLSLYVHIVRCYEAKGMYNKAFQHFLLANKLQDNPEQAQKLRDLYEKEGWKGIQRSAHEIAAKRRKARLEKDPTAYIRSRDIAFEYADLKDKDKTLEYLNKAFEERDYWLVFLKTEYKFDFLKDDPRFQELLKKVNFPETGEL